MYGGEIIQFFRIWSNLVFQVFRNQGQESLLNFNQNSIHLWWIFILADFVVKIVKTEIWSLIIQCGGYNREYLKFGLLFIMITLSFMASSIKLNVRLHKYYHLSNLSTTTTKKSEKVNKNFYEKMTLFRTLKRNNSTLFTG